MEVQKRGQSWHRQHHSWQTDKPNDASHTTPEVRKFHDNYIDYKYQQLQKQNCSLWCS